MTRSRPSGDEVCRHEAKAAAPYMHSRLQSTTVRNPEGEELVIRVVR